MMRASLLSVLAVMASVSAFSPMQPSLVRPKSVSSFTSLSVTPDHIEAVTSISTAMDGMHHMLHSTSVMLADAAADAPEKAGWWKSWLNVFKGSLLFVHSTIDEPLRSVGITQTWGISIAIFTAGVRSLLIPLSVQQSKNSEYTKALKPYMKEIKEKFKDNKEAQNRAIAKLYEDANQNPLAGCLVSIVQLPVFLGLYRGVRLLAQDGQLQEPFLWIPSLEGPVTPPTYRGLEWLTQGWTSDGSFPPTPQLGWETTIAFLIMPIVLVIGQSLTMRVLAPPPDDDMSDEEKETFEKSQGILKFLPLMIGYFSLQVPAGLTIYWLTSNVFTLTQSLAVRAYYTANPPQIELPDYWDALENIDDMSPEERRKAAEAGINTGPKFEDLEAEAKFHYVVRRNPLRAESAAWERVATSSSSVPEPMAEWVASDTSPPSIVSEEVVEVETEASATPTA